MTSLAIVIGVLVAVFIPSKAATRIADFITKLIPGQHR